MGRVKIPMTHITDFKKRKITFETRKKGMFKKALELSTLCDVNLSIIIYTDDQQNPEIFPPDSQKLNALIGLFKRNNRSGSGKNKTYDLSGFFRDRNVKIERELANAKKKNSECKYPTWYDFLNNFSEKDLKDFSLQLDDKIDFVKNRIEYIKNKVSNIQKLDPDSCCGIVVVEDSSNFVLDDVENNRVCVNPNAVNHRPYNAIMSEDDDNGCLCNNFGSYGYDQLNNGNGINNLNMQMQSSNDPNSEMIMFEDDHDKIWYQDHDFFLQSSPERTQQFIDMWLSSSNYQIL